MTEENTNFKITNLMDVQVCSTHMKFSIASLKWTINNYDILSKTKKNIKSSEFYEIPTKNEQRKWHLEIIPVPLTVHTDQITEIQLRKNTSEEIFLEISMSIENVSGKTIYNPKNFIDNTRNGICWKVMPTTITNGLLLNEPASIKTLVINVNIRVYYDTTETIVCKGPSIKSFDSKNWSQDMSKVLRNDQRFHDVTITVQGKIFQAHKVILAARSEVFAAMFSNEMLEKIDSSIEIKDLSPETVEKMLNFIYSDEVDDLALKESVIELMDAAERYNLQKLKGMCIAAMHDNLKVGNVLEIIKAADIYSITDLKRMALCFLVAHRHLFKNQDEFQSLVAERPHLMAEFIDIHDNILETSDI